MTERRMGPSGRLLILALVAAGTVIGAPSGIGLLWFVPYAAVGAILVIRRPSMSIGWFLLALGWCLTLAATPIDATADQVTIDHLGPAVALFAVAPWGSMAFCLFAVLAITFPTGRVPSGRWGLVGRLALGVGVATIVLSLGMPVVSANLTDYPTSVAVPNPFAILPGLPIWQALTPDDTVVPIVALVVGAAVSVGFRVRRASGIERQQLRWFAASIALVVVAVLLGFALASIVPGAAESGAAWLAALLAFPLVPVAIGIAVTRYRLYDIDRIISRTIGWALVSGVLVVTFAGVVIALQAALSGFTQGETLAVAASTLVAFALFQPLRRRVQRTVDRRFDRTRYDAERVVAAFSERLRHELDLETLAGEVDRVASETVRPTTATVWLRPSSRESAHQTTP